MSDLVATVGGTESNSYVDLTFAKTYLGDSMSGDKWLDDSTNQVRSLIHSTTMLDTMINWVGYKASDDQSLEWPRVLPDGTHVDEIPRSVKLAVCELAVYLLSASIPSTDNTISKMEIGPIKFEFNDDKAQAMLPDLVTAMVSYFGSPKRPQGQSAQIVSVFR